MKNYNEMANDVLRRIGEYEIEQRNRRKIMKKVIIPICCFCLVALFGIGLWQGDFFNNTPSIKLDDSAIIGEKDYIEPETNNQASGVGDPIGMIKYGGVNYVQCSTNTKVYTPDKYLGEAYDFEGTYQTGFEDVAGGLYMTKEDPDVLMVELKDGEYTDYIILINEEKQSNKQG